jgi:carbamoyl-phosphate synthase small subunit
MDFDGLLISNGPGDPRMCRATIRNIERALALDVPILGICLGNQLLALAAGAETYKLPFGHRSQNQPCIEVLADGERGRRCVITSQNHGFAVRADSLPADWRLWFVNANDETVEGIRHVSKPVCSVQFHPEANPGPVDSAWIFDDFVEVVKGRRP